MRDRQIFEEYKLKNGIQLYAYPLEVPFASAIVGFSFGTKHNTESILPGSAHFLEHSVFHRSELYPEKNYFQKKLELDGGYFNAYTSPYDTSYLIESAEKMKPWVWEGFINHLSKPIFRAEDLEKDRTIIMNERKMRERWWPGNNEIQHYLGTQWKDSEPFPLRQLFGFEEDMASMTPAYVQNCHQHYFSVPTKVIIGGTYDIENIIGILETIPTQPHMVLQESIKTPFWVHREYHEHAFRDINYPIYYWGGFIAPLPNQQESVVLSFIISLLTNSTHGALYEWLRRDKGWAYGVYSDYSTSPKYLAWSIRIPTSTQEQVTHLRSELHQRVLAALSSQDLVDKEVVRQKNQTVFHFQTLEAVIDSAEKDIDKYGRVLSEAEEIVILEKCRNVDLLKDIYIKHLSPSVSGEFCALPEK